MGRRFERFIVSPKRNVHPIARTDNTTPPANTVRHDPTVRIASPTKGTMTGPIRNTA